MVLPITIPSAIAKLMPCSTRFNLSGCNFTARFACQSNLPAIANSSVAKLDSCSLLALTTASNAPTFRASAARFSLPVVIHIIALSAPIMRGRRTVPPKPGIMPNLTSGKPIFAESLATR